MNDQQTPPISAASSPPPPPPPPPPPSVPNSTMAIISLIAGILGWTLLPILGSLAAIITGHLGKNEIRESRGQLSGEGMAIAGLVLGYLQIIPSILCLCSFIVMMVFGISIPLIDEMF